MVQGRKAISDCFSISGAAEILQRNRRTITRALRGIRPDATENGSRKWRMSVIVRALNEHSDAPILTRGENSETNSDCAAAFANFDKQFAAMKKLPTLAQRRRTAEAMAGHVATMFTAIQERDASLDVNIEHAALRRDKAYQLMLANFKAPCSWSDAEAAAKLPIEGNEEINDDAA